MKALFVAKQCNSGQYFHYADSSTSLPQGPLYYFFECLFGSLGITDYLNILRLEIIISQLLIFFSFYIFKKLDDDELTHSVSIKNNIFKIFYPGINEERKYKINATKKIEYNFHWSNRFLNNIFNK